LEEARDCGGKYGGGAFRNCLAAANEATKNQKIKIRRGLRWLQNNMNIATINQKRAALTNGRWGGTRERWGRRGNAIRSYWGQLSWAGGGNLSKIHQFIKLYYFSADLQNEIKSFDTAIDQSIVEVLSGGLRWNVREGRFAIVWRRDEKYKK
jgi:hypothetical protein